MKTFYTVSNNGEIIDVRYKREEAEEFAEDCARRNPGENFVISKSILFYTLPKKVEPLCYHTEDN